MVNDLHADRVSRYPAALQLGTGALGAGMAFVLACPAMGVASLGALVDGERYARTSDALGMRWASLGVAAFALAAIVTALLAPAEVPRWSLIAFALLGLVMNAVCVIAAFPHRLSQLTQAGRGASASGFAALLGVGLLFVVRPAGWICLAGSVVIGVAIGWARLTRRRFE
jgi:hypothetical protein